MPAENSRQELRYDPGEHRYKHCWDEPNAAFVSQGSVEIGKCPSALSRALAGPRLNDGVGQECPKHIYNLHEGGVYEAVYSDDSWHGYPWSYRSGRQSLPLQIKQELERRAEQQNCLSGYRQWMKDHGR